MRKNKNKNKNKITMMMTTIMNQKNNNSFWTGTERQEREDRCIKWLKCMRHWAPTASGDHFIRV